MSEQKTTEDILASMGVTPAAPAPTTFAGFVEVFDTFRRLVIENERECAGAVGVVDSTLCGVAFCVTTGAIIPAGTKLFAFPPAAIARDSVIEECAKVCAGIDQDWPAMSDTPYPEYIAKKLRAMKSQPAVPAPRDEALRLAREALENCEGAVDELRDYPITHDLLIEALAAIDKVMKEGE